MLILFLGPLFYIEQLLYALIPDYTHLPHEAFPGVRNDLFWSFLSLKKSHQTPLQRLLCFFPALKTLKIQLGPWVKKGSIFMPES